MDENEKLLGMKPLIHENVQLTTTEFGKYNEIGAFNFLENIHFGDYSYSGQFCFFQNTRIGKFSNIAAMVRIGPTEHPYKRPWLHHFTYRGKMYDFSEQDDIEFFEERASRLTYIGHDT